MLLLPLWFNQLHWLLWQLTSYTVIVQTTILHQNTAVWDPCTTMVSEARLGWKTIMSCLAKLTNKILNPNLDWNLIGIASTTDSLKKTCDKKHYIQFWVIFLYSISHIFATLYHDWHLKLKRSNLFQKRYDSRDPFYLYRLFSMDM